MSLTANKTVQHLVWNVSPGGADAHGNALGFFAAPVDMPVYGWGPPSVLPVVENNAGRHQVQKRLDLFAPPGTTVGHNDQIIVDGTTYEVLGDGEDYTTGPFSYQPGILIKLRSSEG